MRMGIHSGSCVAGVVGTKIPHYSVFGDTVEVAGLMESSGEAMKIQVCIIYRHSLNVPWLQSIYAWCLSRINININIKNHVF